MLLDKRADHTRRSSRYSQKARGIAVGIDISAIDLEVNLCGLGNLSGERIRPGHFLDLLGRRVQFVVSCVETIDG
jgi:hypothetical protein